MELKQSHKAMKEPWNPADGFKILHKRFNEVIIFVAFTKNNISAGNTLNLLPNVILKTRIFQIQYGEWLNLSYNEHLLVNALEWWGKKCRIKEQIHKTCRQHRHWDLSSTEW